MIGSARLLLAFTLLAATVGQLGAQCRVWTVTETARVLRHAPATNESSVRIAAAGNEWESFQILLRAGAAVAGVSVEAGDLTGPGGATIPGSAARLFRQHQFELTVPTYRNDDFEPGWYPDA